MSEHPPIHKPEEDGIHSLAPPSSNDTKSLLEIKANLGKARLRILKQSGWNVELDEDSDLIINPSANKPDINLRNLLWLTNAEESNLVRLAVPDFYIFKGDSIPPREFANLVHCMNVITVKYFCIKIHNVRSSDWRFIMFYETMIPVGSLSALIDKAAWSLQHAVEDFYTLLPSYMRNTKR